MIANELVTLLNDVDLTYRSELKDAFAGNIAAFDAKLEQRLAEVLAKTDTRFAQMDAKFEKRFAEQDARIEKRLDDRDVKLSAMETRLVKWMFVFWATGFLAMASLR